ncbi:MAG: hypothetical protein AB9834_08300 [Lentimicrobium sp.]
MKRTIALFTLILTGFSTFGQLSPTMYLSQVPKYMGSGCEITDADTANINAFQNEMGKFRDLLSNEIGSLKDAQEKFMEDNEDLIRESMLGMQGYSKEDAQKLKNADQMSEAEKMAIANNMLMEQTGMDVNDFKKLAEMDTAARKNWAQGYSTMMMADAMSNPQKSQEEQKRHKEQFDLLTEQKFLIEKISAAEGKYFEQLEKLYVEADTAYAQMNREFDKLDKEIDDCENAGCVEAIYEQKNQLKKTYCYQFSPDYRTIVSDLRSYLLTSLDTYNQLDLISNQVTESQTGVKNPDFRPGLSALSIISKYAGLEAGIFRFFHAETVYGIGAEGNISN